LDPRPVEVIIPASAAASATDAHRGSEFWDLDHAVSPRHIFIGLGIGGCLLAGVLALVRYLGLPVISVPIALLITAILAGALTEEHELRRRALRRYWGRGCMGIRWRRRFPDAPRNDIREFLLLFVGAFAFGQRERSCFAPDDRVLDVYRALYPPGAGRFQADCMELEILTMELEEQYGLDLRSLWREDLTLGQIFEHTRARPA
jgi:hypothetical protein